MARVKHEAALHNLEQAAGHCARAGGGGLTNLDAVADFIRSEIAGNFRFDEEVKDDPASWASRAAAGLLLFGANLESLLQLVHAHCLGAFADMEAKPWIIGLLHRVPKACFPITCCTIYSSLPVSFANYVYVSLKVYNSATAPAVSVPVLSACPRVYWQTNARCACYQTLGHSLSCGYCCFWALRIRAVTGAID